MWREAAKFGAALVIVAAAAVLFVQLQEGKAYGLRIGEPAPSFRLSSLSGGEMDLPQRGRVVLVNFWATWCPPCVAEMPSLERLHRALGPEGLVVVSVAADEDGEAVRRFVTDRGVTFPVLRDPGGRTAAHAYQTTGYPETFLVDASGVLREKYVGPAEWDTPEAVGHFRGLLKSLATSPTR